MHSDLSPSALHAVHQEDKETLSLLIEETNLAEQVTRRVDLCNPQLVFEITEELENDLKNLKVRQGSFHRLVEIEILLSEGQDVF